MTVYTWTPQYHLHRILYVALGRVRSTGHGATVMVEGESDTGKSYGVQRWLDNVGIEYAWCDPSDDIPDVAAGLAAVVEDHLEHASSTRSPLWPVALVLDTPKAIPDAHVRYLRRMLDAPVLVILVSPSAMHPKNGPAPDDRVLVKGASPAEIAVALELDDAVAFEAALVTGGLPALLARWRPRESPLEYLERELADPGSPLVLTGERLLYSIQWRWQARQVLQVIGQEATTWTGIQDRARLPFAGVQRALRELLERGLVYAERPLVPGGLRNTRYRPAGAYLGFWLRSIGPYVQEIERGRADLVYGRLASLWEAHVAHAVIPLVREALEVSLKDPAFRRRLGGAEVVGSYWSRSGFEVTLVGTDASVGRVAFVGSLRGEAGRFGWEDLAVLREALSRTPGVDSDTRLVAVSRSGYTEAAREGLDAALTPEDLI